MVDAQIAARTAKERFGVAARAAGRATVSLDHAGNIIKITPDGRRSAV